MKRLSVWLFFLLAALPAGAQSYIQQNSQDGNSPQTAQFAAQNDAAGNAIVVLVSGSEYNHCDQTHLPNDTEGNTFHLLGYFIGTNTNECVFATYSIAGGTKDAVTCYGVNSSFSISCDIEEMHNVNAFDSVTCVSNACISGGTGSGTLSSPSINTNFAAELVWGFGGTGMGGDCPSEFAGGAGAGWTSTASGTVLTEYQVFASTQAGLTATVLKGATSCEYTLGIFAFYQAASGAGGSKSLGPTRRLGPGRAQ